MHVLNEQRPVFIDAITPTYIIIRKNRNNIMYLDFIKIEL